MIGWLLLHQAEIALNALEGEISDRDRSFYAGKVAVANFFAKNELPRLTAERKIVEGVDLTRWTSGGGGLLAGVLQQRPVRPRRRSIVLAQLPDGQDVEGLGQQLGVVVGHPAKAAGDPSRISLSALSS